MKPVMAWSDWDREFRKMIFDREGDAVGHIYNDIATRDHFHDMYQRGLSPLDALHQYTTKGLPKNDGYKIA